MDPKKSDSEKPADQSAVTPVTPNDATTPKSTDMPATPPEATTPDVSTPVEAPTPSPASPVTPTTQEKSPQAVAQPIPSENTTPEVPSIPEMAVPPDSVDSGSEVGYTETKSNKMLYVFIFVLVVVLLSLVGLFFYKQFMTTTSGQLTPTPQVTQTAEVSPTAEPQLEEEQDLRDLAIPDVDEELTGVQGDVDQL